MKIVLDTDNVEDTGQDAIIVVQDVESCNLGLRRRGESRAAGGGGEPAAGARPQRLQRGHLPQLRLRGQQRIQWNLLHLLRYCRVNCSNATLLLDCT